MNQQWAADPWHRADLRWFDGVAWTEQVMRGGLPEIDHPPPLFVSSAKRSPWRRFRSIPLWLQFVVWLAILTLVMSGLGIALAEPPPSERSQSTGYTTNLL